MASIKIVQRTIARNHHCLLLDLQKHSEEIYYLTKTHSGCGALIKLKSGPITPLVSELQRAETAKSVGRPATFFLQGADEDLPQTFTACLPTKVTMAVPGNLQMSRYGPGWALGSLWVARNVLCVDLGGSYEDIYTHIKFTKIHHLR